MTEEFKLSEDFALKLDKEDPLSNFRAQFNIPTTNQGIEEIYFVGNSLGLLPNRARDAVSEEINKWGKHGVKGHGAERSDIKQPWVTYHQPLSKAMSKLVGALDDEVTIMNTLTVNLHLMLISYYIPTSKKNKIIIEEQIFPSDYFAIESQVRQRGYDPRDTIVTILPREDGLVHLDDIKQKIIDIGDELALVFLPGVQFYTGQVFPMKEIVEVAHQNGAYVGFNLAHAVGNIELSLNKWEVDFAVWCTYKYLNSGPGAIAACYINEIHLDRSDMDRFNGWWGTKLETRFEMDKYFDKLSTADAWQISNPPILSMAPIKSSLEIIEEAGGIKELRKKSIKLSNYFKYLLSKELSKEIHLITPKSIEAHGCQLSLKVITEKISGRDVFDSLINNGVSCDWRFPDVIRVAPVPLYNTFYEVYMFVQILKKIILE